MLASFIHKIEWNSSLDGTMVLKLLREHGAMLIQNAPFISPAHWEEWLRSLPIELTNYLFGQSPRQNFTAYVSSATEYHPHHTIPSHHELSYTSHPPRFVFFYCAQSATTGGETTLVDGFELYENMSTSPILQKFIEQGFIYKKCMPSASPISTRLPILGKSWQEHFLISEGNIEEQKQRVQEYCDTNDILYHWLENNALQTAHTRPAIRFHTEKQRYAWYAQPNLWKLPVRTQSFLEKHVSLNQYPIDITLGNGDLFSEKYAKFLDYQTTSIEYAHTWSNNDMLLLDNWRIAHGRKAFTGNRYHWVALANDTNT